MIHFTIHFWILTFNTHSSGCGYVFAKRDDQLRTSDPESGLGGDMRPLLRGGQTDSEDNDDMVTIDLSKDEINGKLLTLSDKIFIRLLLGFEITEMSRSGGDEQDSAKGNDNLML